jgi:hypothetical protein
MPLPNLIWREPTTLPKRGSGVMKPVLTISTCFLLGSVGLLWAFGGSGESPAVPNLAKVAPTGEVQEPVKADPRPSAAPVLAEAEALRSTAEAETAAMPPLPPARPRSLDLAQADNAPAPVEPIVNPTQWSAVPTRVTKDDVVRPDPEPTSPAAGPTRPLVATLQPDRSGADAHEPDRAEGTANSGTQSPEAPPLPARPEVTERTDGAQGPATRAAVLDFEAAPVPKPEQVSPAAKPDVTTKPEAPAPEVAKAPASPPNAAEPARSEPEPAKVATSAPEASAPKAGDSEAADEEIAETQGTKPGGASHHDEVAVSEPPKPTGPAGARSVPDLAPEETAAALNSEEETKPQLRREKMVERARRNKSAAAKRQKQRILAAIRQQELAEMRRLKQRPGVVDSRRNDDEEEVYVYEVVPQTESYYYYPQRRRSVFVDSFM